MVSRTYSIFPAIVIVASIFIGALPRTTHADFIFAGGKWEEMIRHRCCGQSPTTFHLIRGTVESYEGGRIRRYTIFASRDRSPVPLREGDFFLAAGFNISIRGFGIAVFVPVIIASLPPSQPRIPPFPQPSPQPPPP